MRLFPMALVACALAWMGCSIERGTALGDEGVQYPLAVAIAPQGDVYLADRNLPGIWKWRDGATEIFFRGDKKFRTPLNAIRCLAVEHDGAVLAGDSATRQVYRLKADGAIQPLALPVDEPSRLGPLGIPMGIAVNSKREIFVSDLEFHCIWVLPPEGGPARKFAELAAPIGLACAKDDVIWAVSRVEGPVRRIRADGQVETVVEGRPFEFPHHLAVDDDGAVLVVDGYKKAVWRVPAGKPPEVWFTHERFVNPVDIKRWGDSWAVIDPRAKALFRVGADRSVEIFDLTSRP